MKLLGTSIAALALLSVSACNDAAEPRDPVAARPHPAIANLDNITIDSGAPDRPGANLALLEDEMTALRADATALGADAAYEEYYYDKLRETPQWGLDTAAAAPEFVLKDSTGKEVSLADLRAGNTEGPILVYFYRGGWSPTSTTQLKWLATAYPEFQKAGAQVVAVTPEEAEYIATTVSENQVPFPVLSDQGGTVTQSYRVGYQPDTDMTTRLQGYGVNLSDRNAGSNWLPVNSAYLIDRSGNVVWRGIDTGTGPGIDLNSALSEIQRMRTPADARAADSSAADRAVEGDRAGERATEGDQAGDRASEGERAGDRAEDSRASDR